jgi:two-component system OmpR family sensor kinase
LVTQVVLLAVVCAGIGIATEFALQRFLLHQLDQQVIEAGRRSAAMFAFGPPPPPGFRPPRHPPGPPFGPPPDYPRRIIIREDDGPGPAFLNAPGQSTRTVGAVIAQGVPVDAGVITADGAPAEISAAATEQLAQVAPNRHPTRSISTGSAATGWWAITLTARRRRSSSACRHPMSMTRWCGCW